MKRLHALLVLASAPLLTAPASSLAGVAAEATRARAIQAARRLQKLPEPFGPSLEARELQRDLLDLASLEAPLLQRGTWRVLRSGENARHVAFSGDGRSLGWVDEARMNLRVWTMGPDPTSDPIAGAWVDYLSLDQDGTRALMGVHRFQQEATDAAGVQLVDDLRHQLRAVGGPSVVAARNEPAPRLRHSVGAFVGAKALLFQSDLVPGGPADWPVPGDLEALWFEPHFHLDPVDLEVRGVSYTLLRRPPTRVLKPSFAPLAEKVFVGMGVARPPGDRRPPRLVLRGLRPLGSHPGMFAELGHRGNLEFDVPGAPLSLAASPDGEMFAYTHGAAGSLVEVGGAAGMRFREDGERAVPSKGIWILRPGRDPVLVPHPHEAPVYEVAWRPDGLELLASTDLDEDGVLDVAVYDLTPMLRNQQRRWAVLGKPRPADSPTRRAAATPPASSRPEAVTPPAEAAPPAPTRAAARPIPSPPAPAAASPSRTSGNLQRLLAAGEKALASGHAIEALARADEAKELAPEDFEPAWLHARASVLAGDLDGGARELEALERHPRLPADKKASVQARAAQVRGQQLLSERKVGPGLAKLARAVTLWEDAANPAFPALVQECQQRKLYTDGLRYAERWVDAGGGDPAREAQVRLLSGAGKAPEAIELARALVRKNSFSAREKILLGDALLAAGEASEALRVFREAKTLAPDHQGLDSRIFEAESSQVLGQQN